MPSVGRLLLCGAALARLAVGRVDDLADAEVLVQVASNLAAEEKPARKPVEQIFVTTANTTEDLVFWAVMYKTLRAVHPVFINILVVPPNSALWQHRVPIGFATYEDDWKVSMQKYNPEELNLKAVTAMWQQLTPFQYSALQYKRVAYLDSNMVVLKSFRDMLEGPPGLKTARDQGNCDDIDQAVEAQKPSTALYTMVPDERIEGWLKSPGTETALMREASGEVEVSPATALMRDVSGADSNATALARESAEAGSRMKFDGKNLAPLAFQMMYPKTKQSFFHGVEVVSASCLLHHGDEDYPDEFPSDIAKIVLLGSEGKQLVKEILSHGEKRLTNTVATLEKAGKVTMAKALRMWFDAYNSWEVQNIIAATKNW